MKKLLLIIALFIVGKLNAATYYSQVTGIQNMSVLTNWNANPGGGGSNPSNLTTSGDLFIIQSSHDIQLSAALVFGASVNLEIAGRLDAVANNLTIGGTTNLTGSGRLVDNSSLGTNTFVGLVTLNTSGSWITSANSNAANTVFNSGITNTAGTFSSGAATISASQTITPTASMTFNGAIVCSGNLNVANGQVLINSSGSSSISGTFTIGTGGFSKTGGSLTVTGLVTTTGPWNSNVLIVFEGGIVNNSSNTFTCNPAIFNASGTNQNISGTGAYLFTGNVTISSSKSVTNQCSNSNGVTVTGKINGGNASSEWINSSNTLLNYTSSTSGNTPMITGKLTVTASGNFVAYSRNGSIQNIKTTTYSNLRISGGGQKIVLAPVPITESLDLVNGVVISTNTKYLNLKDGATTNIGSATSFVDGQLWYDMAFSGSRTLLFPIGSGSDWRPLEIKVTHSTANSYTYRGRLFNASAAALGYSIPVSVDNVSLAHYWDVFRYKTGTNTLEPSLDLSGNQTIKIYYGLNDNVPDAANLTICNNNDAAITDWYDIGGTGATNFSGNVTSTSSPTGFTAFRRFTLGNKDGGTNPLPVTLVSFSANCNANRTNLEWTTATEINNNFFTIEMSNDGRTWNAVKNITGAGNSYELRNYSTSVPNSISATAFYRLKQTDFDGTFDYSDVIVVRNCSFENSDNISIYPNPSNGIVNCNFTGIKETVEAINVYNVMGELVYSSSEFSDQLNLLEFPSGIYFAYFLQNGSQVSVQKIVLQK